MKAPSISESAWLRTVREAAAALHWRSFHPWLSVKSEPGWPDLILCRPETRQVIAIELKAAKGRLTMAQCTWLDALNECGILSIVARPDDFEWLIELLR